MKRHGLCVTLILLGIVSVGGCRSRHKVPPPRPLPAAPTEQALAPATPVAPMNQDFVARDADVLPEDLSDLNRVARVRGWIRDAFFAFDVYTLEDDARDALNNSAAWLRDNPKYAIRIEGHTDDRGTEQYNLALGDRRSATAADYLSALGIDKSRMVTISYGESRPFERGDDENAWAQNRRAHLVIMSR